MADHLFYLTKEALDKLKKNVRKNDYRYKSSDPGWIEFFKPHDYRRESKIEIVGDDFDSCLGDSFNSKSINKTDPERCVLIYKALQNLTPQQATDERIWTYLTHFVFWDYSRTRWLGPETGDKLKKAVDSHFFVGGVRGMVRDNAISRLWWMAHVCNRLDYDLKDCLEALMFREDVRANVMERASFCRSVPVMNSLMKYLLKSWKGNQELHDRETFRNMCKELNRVGGVRLLDSMKPNELDDLMESIIDEKLHLSPEFK